MHHHGVHPLSDIGTVRVVVGDGEAQRRGVGRRKPVELDGLRRLAIQLLEHDTVVGRREVGANNGNRIAFSSAKLPLE